MNAVPTISKGLAGLTARLGSLSWLVSRESDLGIMLVTSTRGPAAAASGFAAGLAFVLGIAAGLRFPCVAPVRPLAWARFALVFAAILFGSSSG